jgi:hypothetical protein
VAWVHCEGLDVEIPSFINHYEKWGLGGIWLNFRAFLIITIIAGNLLFPQKYALINSQCSELTNKLMNKVSISNSIFPTSPSPWFEEVEGQRSNVRSNF